jgi:hypothetical protein
LEKEALADSSEEKGGAGKGLFLDGGRAPKEVVCQRKKPKRPAKGKEKREEKTRSSSSLFLFARTRGRACCSVCFARSASQIKRLSLFFSFSSSALGVDNEEKSILVLKW